MAAPFLTPQFFRVDFGQGLDTKSDPKVVSSGKMVQLDNARFQNNNRVSKRYGYTSLDNLAGAQISRLNSFQGNLIGWGDPFVPAVSTLPRSYYTYNQLQATPAFVPILPSFNDFLVKSAPIVADNDANQQGDSATANGATLYAWVSTLGTPGINYKIVNATTGLNIQQQSLLSSTNGTKIRCVAAGNNLLFGYSTTAALFVNSFDTTQAFGFQQTIFATSTSVATPAWDWAPINIASQTTGVFMAYQSSISNINMAILRPTSAAQFTGSVSSSSITISTLGVIQPVPTEASTSLKFVYVGTDSCYHYVQTNTSLTVTVNGISVTAASAANSQVLIGQELSNQTSSLFFNYSQTAGIIPALLGSIVGDTVNVSGTTATFGGTNASVLGQAIHSKPLYINDNNIYFWGLHPSEVQGQYNLFHYCNYSNAQNPGILSGCLFPAARIMTGNAMGITQGGGTIAAVNMNYLQNAQYACSAVSIALQDTFNGQLVQTGGINNITMDNTFTDAYQAVNLNKQLLVTGGFPALYDSNGFTEAGFFMYPEGVTAVSSTTRLVCYPREPISIYSPMNGLTGSRKPSRIYPRGEHHFSHQLYRSTLGSNNFCQFISSFNSTLFENYPS